MAGAGKGWQAAGCSWPRVAYIARMETLFLYHDFTSPFCRVALEVAAAVAERLEAELRPVPWELRPAPAPLPPPDDAALGAEIEAALPLARELGVALEPPPRVPRTHKAHEAVVHARAAGHELAALRALYDAYWRDGADIGRIDVVAEVGADAGVDGESLHVALGLDEHETAVEAAQRAAEAAGITGVPAFQMGDRVLVGLVPVDELLEWATAGSGSGER